MKTATWHILTFSIWIGVLAGSQVLAQQTKLDKQSSRITTSKIMYVAQQQGPTDQSNIPTITQPSQNSTPALTSSQAKPSNPAPDASLPNEMPADSIPQAMADSNMGVENGLWDGCEPGNGCAICGGGYCTPPDWYFEQGARVLTRTAPRNKDISFEFREVTIFNPATGQVISKTLQYDSMLDTHSINYNIAPGYIATIGRYLGRDAMDRDDFLEFSYWGMNTWADATSADSGFRNQFEVTNGPSTFIGGDLVTPFLVGQDRPIPAQDSAFFFNQPANPPLNDAWGVGGFDHVDTHSIKVDSEIHNFELNLRLRPRGRPDQLVLHPNGRWRRECQPGTFMSYLVGLRYLTLGDGFHFHSQGTVTVTDNFTGDTITKNVSGDYDILTENDLLGLQIGTDLMFRRCKWAWGVRAKLGPYVNFSRNVKQIVNDPVGAPELRYFFNDRFTQRRQKASMIGELGFEATYRFRPNLIGRAAYDFMWITGLALAPEQLTWNLDSSRNDTINNNGTIYAHGISLGLEWSW